MQRRVVIRNSFLHGSYGLEEINQPSFPFKTGHPFDLIIRCEHDKIKVGVREINYFKNSDVYDCISGIRIEQLSP